MMRDTELNYFHFLFEAKDISMTTRTLGSDEMNVKSRYSWTPLDYYVTGLCDRPCHLSFQLSLETELCQLFH